MLMKTFVSKVFRATLALFVLAAILPAAAQVMLVPRGSTWKYHNLNTDLGTIWRTPEYDDSTWAGPSAGPLGDNVETSVQRCTTVIDIGPANARYPGIYYRR